MPFINPENQQARISGKVEAAIAAVRDEAKLTLEAIVAPTYMAKQWIMCQREIANRYSLKLIVDNVQGFGTLINSKHPPGWANAAITIFSGRAFGR